MRTSILGRLSLALSAGALVAGALSQSGPPAPSISTTELRPTSASSVPHYTLALLKDAKWTFSNPGACSPTVGKSENLVERGTTYPGACYGAAQPPKTVSHGDDRSLSFRTDKDYRYPKGSVRLVDKARNRWVETTGARKGSIARDRSELQTPWNLPLGTDVWVGFQLRIPAGVDDVTGSGAFLMQLWQCQYTPIAGIRIQAGKGNGHHIQFVRRGDVPVAGVNYDKSMTTVDLGPHSTWHSFVVKWHVTPYKKGGPMGRIAVYHKGPTGAEHKILGTDQYFGVSKATSCKGPGFDRQAFKLKFGMYKDYQPGATFRADFRNVRVGSTKASVQPY